MNTSRLRDVLKWLLTRVAVAWLVFFGGYYRVLARMCRIVGVAALKARCILDEIADEIQGVAVAIDLDEWPDEYDA